MSYTVAVYLCDRAYGGPEEGGWWYACGVPSEEHAHHTRGFVGENSAYVYARKLNDKYGALWNEGRRDVNSVLSEGQYYAEVFEGNPRPYPAAKPVYD